MKEIVFFLQIDLICENLVYFNIKEMSKKKCFVNGASFTIKNCGIQLEDLITTAVGKKKTAFLGCGSKQRTSSKIKMEK